MPKRSSSPNQTTPPQKIKKQKKFDSRFPPIRIKQIMQQDDTIGKVAQTAPVVMGKAVECFLEDIMVKSLNFCKQVTDSKEQAGNKDKESSNEQNYCVTSNHIKNVIRNDPNLFKIFGSTLMSVVDEKESKRVKRESSVKAEQTTTTSHSGQALTMVKEEI